MDGVKRNLHERAQGLLDKFPVLVILGSRQCGKTTLSKQLRPDWKYFDLENPRDYDYIVNDPLLFFEQNQHSVIIDEAQIEPKIFATLRGIIDQRRELKGRFILTGSSSPDLLAKGSESLAGRAAYIELSPLKTNERLQQPLSSIYDFFANPKEDFDFKSCQTALSLSDFRQQWLCGGYPEPTIDFSLDFWREWMIQYRDSYINRDIASLFPKLNRVTYRRFMQMLAKLSGTIINKSDLARSLEVSQPSITQYLDIAHDTFLWRNINSYSDNKIKSLIKMPKGILRDTGILHFLLKIEDPDTLLSDPIVGLSFEGFVIEEIIRGMQVRGSQNLDYYFYRTKHGAEVDLIISGPYGYIPIEIKYGSHTPLKNLNKLQEFVNIHDLPLGIVINNSDKIAYLAKNIIQVPTNYI